ncbi:MAG: GDP-mannose 4,6-dehydratase [Eubacterium sp.]|nr:GDP-mannose 4,6-dehydratase [Eubacterium sp.]
MKSLIIGGSGFVGAYLARHLRELGHKAAVTKMPQEQAPFLEADACGMDILDLDILEYDAVVDLINKTNPDFIFHLAAQSSVAVSWKNPCLTADVNIKGSIHVLEAVRRQEKKSRILLVGSGEEYGAILPDEIPVREGHMVKPGNIYAATKACQNQIGAIYAQAYGMDAIMVRAFNHIGPHQASCFVVSDFCRQAAEIEAGLKEPVIWTGNLEAKRDFTDVRDIVRAYALLAQRGQAGETYNVGSGHAARIGDILKLVLERTAAEICVKEDPAKIRPLDVPVIEADITKLKRLTGWEPKISLEQTVSETLDAWRTEVRSKNC